MMTEFEKLVLEMRQAQKDYFRFHDQQDLKKARILEIQVDGQLERKQQQDQEPTPDLFEAGSAVSEAGE